MKILREAGAALIMLFALNINAQQFVGLPQYGVSLEGLVDNPSVVNTSGKGILAYIVRFRNAQGIGHGEIILETRELRHGIVRQGPVPSNGIRSRDNEGPITSATLDAVAFDTGEFVGQDLGQEFPVIAAVIDAERALGEAVLHQKISWEAVEALAKEHRPLANASREASSAHHAQVTLARDLQQAKVSGDEMKMAEWCSKLPRLRRVQ